MQRKAVTLVEVLTVVGVVGLLIGLLLPAIQQVRAAADKLACQSNLKQIALAVHHYHADFKHVPVSPFRYRSWQTEPSALLSKLTHLLPYVEETDAFSQAVQACRTQQRPWINPPHENLTKLMRLYRCPSDSRLSSTMTDADGIVAAYGSYQPCLGSGERDGAGIFFGELTSFRGATGNTIFRGISFDRVRDGVSNTVMFGERPPPDSLQAGKWYPSYSTRFGVNGDTERPGRRLVHSQCGIGA